MGKGRRDIKHLRTDKNKNLFIVLHWIDFCILKINFSANSSFVSFTVMEIMYSFPKKKKIKNLLMVSKLALGI